MAVADSKGYMVAPSPSPSSSASSPSSPPCRPSSASPLASLPHFSPDAIANIIKLKSSRVSLSLSFPHYTPGSLESFQSHLHSLIRPTQPHCKLIVIDATASPSTLPLLQFIHSIGHGGVALANKLPLCVSPCPCPFPTFSVSSASPSSPSTLFRYESTVCAGTPVISTLCRLLCSGDKVRRVRGSLSGTLAFLFSSMQTGRAFSSILKEARERGWTEPDPREDLNGRDVARKALILARTLGIQGEMEKMAIESLFPPDWSKESGMGVEEFVKRVEEGQLDGDWQRRSEEAGSRGDVLRYIADIDVEKGTIRVGISPVGRETALGRLEGTDNFVEYHTEIYDQKPLILQGSGAGGETTACGIIGDTVEMAMILKQQAYCNK